MFRGHLNIFLFPNTADHIPLMFTFGICIFVFVKLGLNEAAKPGKDPTSAELGEHAIMS